ncbi:PREDICTED: patched domain-containing protein 3-like isoform X1 [Polistes canadensis]|uniref:patched domain-containing protein 3-like isoform X1 n=1 Tax=Polistes canadensis TaxID=91411 RepID=UPI000718B980|nr:PREDICTED: patched domain-containing protein 3-like isoform X1 [Polistes canadensis]
MENDSTKSSTINLIWKRLKKSIIDIHLNPDQLFYRIGLSIGNKPWVWLIVSLIINCICCPGMIFWKEEVDDVELCLPMNSKVRADALWVQKHFRDDLRYESIIVTAPNVLEPEVLQSISEIENEVKNIVVKNHTWKDVCASFLTWFEEDEHLLFEDVHNYEFSDEIMKNLNQTMLKDGCIYQSLLKLWQGDDISALTKKKVLRDVTKAVRDKSKNHILHNVVPLLSDIEYDEMNNVKSAKATILNWMLKKSNPYSPEWELEFIERVLNGNRSLPLGMEIYAVSSRSFKDVLHEVMMNNMPILCCGLSLITIYVLFMIGKCNAIEQRLYLSLMGVSVVGQALISSYGVCYYLGYFYGPLHRVLPFLLLGIGVDDMFVIMHSLEMQSESDKALEIPLRIAKVVQHAGMSITVTSFTNLVAFGIGMTTMMPFLKSFCMFATMGILFLYIFELTFFVSCLVYDERRLENKREGCCCRPRSEWKRNECSKRNLQQIIFENYIGPFLMKTYVKVVVITITVCLVCVNIWAIFQLEQDFDPLLYLNQDSYPIRFNEKLKEYFPAYGKHGAVYITDVDYYEDRDSLFRLVDTLKNNSFINNHILDPWFIAYDKWLNNTNKAHYIESKDEYYGVLTEYLLLTMEGQAHIKDIKFDKLPIDDYNITSSRIPIQHVLVNRTSDQIKAMQSMSELIEITNLSHSHVVIYSPEYVSWSANKIIGEELIRNLSLAIVAIGLVTILLLRNLLASFWVISCVIFTLIDLLGSMHFLGLIVEISSSILVLLCIGLAVDYASHVGLEFIRRTGSKNERAIATLKIIGPPVFNGGFSTFLAFILLASSKAYLFSTFFKLFTAVVAFGLFHGLLFLPIILSLLGPNERKVTNNTPKECDMKEANGYYTVHLPNKAEDAGGGREN